jgi:hypothetical protein
MSDGALQELPLYVSAFPLLSTAAQNDADAHDTEGSALVPSMLDGSLQKLPLYVSAFPLLSTAAQNDADGHDTELAENDGSTGTGADQPLEADAVDGPTSTIAAVRAKLSGNRRGSRAATPPQIQAELAPCIGRLMAAWQPVVIA